MLWLNSTEANCMSASNLLLMTSRGARIWQTPVDIKSLSDAHEEQLVCVLSVQVRHVGSQARHLKPFFVSPGESQGTHS